MRKVKIITDSCADLGADILQSHNIDYARMSIVEDGKESPALLTWSNEDAHQLYDTIRGGSSQLFYRAADHLPSPPFLQ